MKKNKNKVKTSAPVVKLSALLGNYERQDNRQTFRHGDTES